MEIIGFVGSTKFVEAKYEVAEVVEEVKTEEVKATPKKKTTKKPTKKK